MQGKNYLPAHNEKFVVCNETNDSNAVRMQWVHTLPVDPSYFINSIITLPSQNCASEKKNLRD